jgi:hypothetical protein
LTTCPVEEDDEGENEAAVDANDLRSRMGGPFALVYDVLGEGMLTA